MLTEAHIKERLSVAYVDALAGRAGVNVSTRRNDYGVDGTFHPVVSMGGALVESGFPVEFQLKSSINWMTDSADIVYDLEVRAYNSMVGRDPKSLPLVLILLCLPQKDSLWLRHSEKGLFLKNCCYWLWLPAGKETQNQSTVRVRIPRANRLTPEAIDGLLMRARAYAKGERNDV